MRVFAYRATERGIRQRSSARLAEERSRRMAAQRAAWEAEQAEKEAARIRKIRAEERRLEMQAEMRALGIKPHKSFHEIEMKAMRVFGVSRSALHSDRRIRRIVLAKQFVAYWAVRLTSLSLPQIGRLMGGKDHTTILHGRDSYPEKRAKMGRYLRPAR